MLAVTPCDQIACDPRRAVPNRPQIIQPLDVQIARAVTVVKLRAYRDQAAIVGSNAKPGFSINDQVADNNLDAVVAVAEVLNQFRHGFTKGGVPEYATAFGEALSDLMAKHWPET
jgi:hypothetical protein